MASEDLETQRNRGFEFGPSHEDDTSIPGRCSRL